MSCIGGMILAYLGGVEEVARTIVLAIGDELGVLPRSLRYVLAYFASTPVGMTVVLVTGFRILRGAG